MVKLSVIIPAHNNTIYLKPLLEKLMKQKTEEVEIIVVEDGSTEDMSFIDNYDVISIHHKERKLPSGARNIGLDIAKGEYIAFLDSDDDICDDFIETHLKMAETGCDYCAYRFYADKQLTPSWKHEKDIWSLNVWSYLFKKDYIGDKRFDESIEFNEDIEFLRRVIKGGNRKELDKFMVYYNNENPTSQSKKYEQLKNKNIKEVNKMIKCEVIKEFDLKAFNELKDIKRAGKDVKGSLFVGDTFECSQDMVEYLTGNNPIGEVVVKVIEVEPETVKNIEAIPEEYKNVIVCFDEPKPKKSKKNKK